MTAPVILTWDGEAFVPATQFQARICDKNFVIGEQYRMVEHHERSHASHAHYFAALNEGWSNLPEHLAERFPTSEHLRKYALIRCGYCDTHTLVASSKAEAQRLAAFIRPTDEFAVVTVNEATLTRYTAQSQSMKAMGKEAFQKSKTDVLDFVASLIGTKPSDMAQNARVAA